MEVIEIVSWGKRKAELPVVLTDEEVQVIPGETMEVYKKMKDEHPETAKGMLGYFRSRFQDSQTTTAHVIPDVPIPPPPAAPQKKAEQPEPVEPAKEEQKEIQVVSDSQLIHYKLDMILDELRKR